MNQLSSWIIQKDPQTNKLLFESLNLFTILITYCSNKNISIHMKRNGDDKKSTSIRTNDYPSLYWQKMVSSFSFRSRMGQARLDTQMTDTTGQWISSGGSGNDYNSTCTETLSSETADVNVTTDGKKQAKCEIQETHPSIALGCQPFVNETNTLARNSLAS